MIFFLDISLAVPIANGVSFVSTSIVGTLIGEEKPKLSKLLRKSSFFNLTEKNNKSLLFHEYFQIVIFYT